MSGYRLRPHHALCIGFFEGKGYSEKFVRNMTEVIAYLEAADPLLTLTVRADIICRACPNDSRGRCCTEEKVRRYDNAVLELCGIDEGEALHWSRLSELVSEKILSADRLSEVCADCCWYGICSSKTFK